MTSALAPEQPKMPDDISPINPASRDVAVKLLESLQRIHDGALEEKPCGSVAKKPMLGQATDDGRWQSLCAKIVQGRAKLHKLVQEKETATADEQQQRLEGLRADLQKMFANNLVPLHRLYPKSALRFMTMARVALAPAAILSGWLPRGSAHAAVTRLAGELMDEMATEMQKVHPLPDSPAGLGRANRFR